MHHKRPETDSKFKRNISLTILKLPESFQMDPKLTKKWTQNSNEIFLFVFKTFFVFFSVTFFFGVTGGKLSCRQSSICMFYANKHGLDLKASKVKGKLKGGEGNLMANGICVQTHWP